MADIELVIKIPEDEYEDVKYFGTIVDEDRDYIASRILNGVILPKGHGRIADIDEAIKCIEEVKGKDAIYAISLIEWACSKRTIIEADTSEEEDK